MIIWMKNIKIINPIEKAALLIKLAFDGELFPEIINTTLERDCYSFRYKFHIWYRLSVWCIIICEILRQPHWTYRYENWNDKSQFPRSSIGYLSENQILILEFISLVIMGCFLLTDIILEIVSFQLTQQSNNTLQTIKKEIIKNIDESNIKLSFKSNPDRTYRRIFIYVLIIIYLLKIIEFFIHFGVIIEEIHSSKSFYHIKSSVYLNTFPLECVYALIIEKRYYYILKTIFRAFPRFFFLLAQFLVLICFFTGFLLVIINSDTPAAINYFDTFSDALWTNVNIMNAADWPTPFVDLYKQSKVWVIFFIIFIATTNWGMLNCILGLILGFYRTLCVDTQLTLNTRSLLALSTAYEILYQYQLESQQTSQSNPISNNVDNDNLKISFQLFRLLMVEVSNRFTHITGHPSKKWKQYFREKNLNLSEDDDVDFLLGVINFHFRRLQQVNYELSPNDIWRSAIINTPFRPAFDWIEEYCSDLPLLDRKNIINLQRNTLSSKFRNEESSSINRVIDITEYGIPINLFFQFFATLILKQDIIIWLNSIDTLCHEIQSFYSYSYSYSLSHSLSSSLSNHYIPPILPNDVENINPLNINKQNINDNETKKDQFISNESILENFNSRSKRYNSILNSKHEENLNNIPRFKVYFDNNIRLQWIASRYEYKQQIPYYFIIPCTIESKLFNTFISTINSRNYQILTDTIITFFCVLIICGLNFQPLRIIVLILTILETSVRYIGKRWKQVIQSYRYRVDTITTIALFLIYILTDHQKRKHDFALICTIRLVLFLPRNILLLDSMRSYRRTIKFGIRQCILASFDAILLLLFLLIVGLIFAGVGVKAFGGLIQTSGNDTYPDLSSSIYGDSNYYVLNYNDSLMGLGTLFLLLMVNNSFIISRGFEVTTKGSSCRLFFVAWYVIGVLFILNLFTASILTSFMSFWVVRHQAKDTEINNIKHEIDNNLHRMNSKSFDLSSNLNSNNNNERSTKNKKIKNYHENEYEDEDEHTFIPKAISIISPQQDDQITNSISIKPEQNITNSVRRRYSNLVKDDELFKWMQNFNEIQEMSDPTISSQSNRLTFQNTNHTNNNNINDNDNDNKILLNTFYHQQEQQQEQQEHKLESNNLIMSQNTFNTDTSHFRDLKSIMEISQNSIDYGDTNSRISESIMHHNNNNDNNNDNDRYQQRKRILSLNETSAFPSLRKTINLSNTMKFFTFYSYFEEQKYKSMTIVEYVATLLQCAKNGRNKVNFKTREKYLCYRASKTYAKYFRWSSWLLCLLTFFSKPRWSLNESQSDNKDLYPTSNVPHLPTEWSTSLTIILLIILTIGLTLDAIFNSNSNDNSEKSENNDYSDNSINLQSDQLLQKKINYIDNLLKKYFNSNFISASLPIFFIVCNFLLIISLITSEWIVSSLELFIICYVGIRWLVLVYLLWFNALYLKALLILIRTLPSFIVMIGIYVIFVIIFGIIGRLIFIDLKVPNNDQYFGTLSNSIFTVFVALSSSSFPDQVIPGYTDERITILYFFIMITFGSFIFLKLQFVAIFTSFESNRQLYELKNRLLTLQLLHIAFEAMDVHKLGYITFPQINEVLEELYTYYSGFKKSGIPSHRERALLLRALDKNGDGKIYYEDFMIILDLTRIQVNEEVEGHYLNYISPKTVESTNFINFYRKLHSRKFRLFIDILLLIVSVIVIIIVGITNSTTTIAVDVFEVILFMIILFDLIIKVGVVGPKRVWSLEWFKYDLIIEFFILLFGFISAPLFGNINSLRVVFRGLLLLRTTFCIRNFDTLFPYAGFGFMFSSLSLIGRRVIEFMVPAFIIMYGFASLGVTLFGGLINKDPDRNQYNDLQSSNYGESDYYELNFNDMPNSFVILFTCLHVSGWDVITSGFSAVTNNLIGRFYFSMWYCIGVLLLMNILTSFFISEFILKLGTHDIMDNSSKIISNDNNNNDNDNNDNNNHDNDKRTISSVENQFIRRNILTIKQSSLDETMLEYPHDDYLEDKNRNSMQIIINEAKSMKEKKKLQYLSTRYSGALKNERISEVKSLLTAANIQSSEKRKNFIIDCENVRDLTDEELMKIMKRMIEPHEQSED